MIDPKLKLVQGDEVYARLYVHVGCVPGQNLISLSADPSDLRAPTVRLPREAVTMASPVLTPGDEVERRAGGVERGVVRHLIGDQVWVRWFGRDSVEKVEDLTRTRAAIEVMTAAAAAGAEAA